MEYSLNCHCGNAVEFTTEALYDVTKDPDLKDSILSGSFLNETCPVCGNVIKPELPILLRYDKGRTIQLIPEMERNSFFLGNVEVHSGSTVVIGYDELVEKIKILDSGLKEIVIEALKLSYLQKVNDWDSVKIQFNDFDQDYITFHIFGVEDDKVGISKIPLSIYEKVEKTVEEKKNEDPFRVLLEGPYISVRKLSDE